MSIRYAEIIESRHVGEVYRVRLATDIRPKPGQFISVIFPFRGEVPLSVGGSGNGVLELYIESERLYKALTHGRRYVLVKGPLGRPLEIDDGYRYVFIAYRNWIYDLKYLIEEARRRNVSTEVKPVEDESSYTRALEEISKRYDSRIVASVPRDWVARLPKRSLVYVRWVKMNCMLGVCGVCSLGRILPCIDGPFIEAGMVEGSRP